MSGLLAVLIGIFLVNLIQPGHVDPSVAQALLGEASQVTASSGLLEAVEGKTKAISLIYLKECSYEYL